MVLDQYAYRTKQQFSSDVFSYNEINRDEVEQIPTIVLAGASSFTRVYVKLIL